VNLPVADNFDIFVFKQNIQGSTGKINENFIEPRCYGKVY
jgi:hypothetical protein